MKLLIPQLASGAFLQAGTELDITVEASPLLPADTQIAVMVRGVQVAVLSAPPFRLKWRVPADLSGDTPLSAVALGRDGRRLAEVVGQTLFVYGTGGGGSGGGSSAGGGGPIAPTVTSVAPAMATRDVERTITVNGTNFAAGAVVRIGATASGSVTVASPTVIKAVVPAGIAAGGYAVSVEQTGSPAATLAAAYTAVGAPTWIRTRGPGGGELFSLVIDPTNPGTLYAQSIWSIYRSTDRGDTWQALSDLTPDDYRPYTGFDVDSATPTTMYAARYNGRASRSLDGGATWADMPTSMTATNYVRAHDTVAGRVFLGRYLGANSLARSIDSGVNWTAATTSAEGNGSHRSMAFHPTDATIAYIASGTDTETVERSTDGGVTWTNIIGGLGVSRFASVAIDPAAPAVLYIGGTGVYKSVNEGIAWTAAGTGLPSQTVNSLGIAPSHPQTLYAVTTSGLAKSIDGAGSWTALSSVPILPGWSKEPVIDPAVPNRAWWPTSHGVLRTMDGGATFTLANQGLDATAVHALVVDPAQQDTVYAGTRGSGVGKSTDGGQTWQSIYTGIEGKVVNGLTVSQGTVFAGTGTGLFKLAPAATTWSASGTGLASTNVSAVWAVDGATTLYAATAGGVHKSTNDGASWTLTNTGIPSFSGSCFAVDPRSPNTIYLGLNGQGVYKTVNGAGNWVAANTGIAGHGVRSIGINQQTPDTLYAGTNAGVYKSTNAGVSWTATNTGLSNTDVKSVWVDPSQPSIIVVATADGIFRSLDGAASWTAFGNAVGVNATYALAGHANRPARLFVGTQYLGVLRADY